MGATVLSVVGARPQFIKAAAVSRALAQTPSLEETMVHTGQHFDERMSHIFFDELAIPPPAHHLEIHGGGHGEMTGRMLAALEPLIEQIDPAVVLVYGDTNSTLAGALAAAKLRVPIAHVEAGLRSFNRRMPEEVNRVVADHLSDLLLCPTSAAVGNLRSEGITAGVRHVGDVMYDAALFSAAAARDRSSILEQLDLGEGSYSVATIHRAENTDSPEGLAATLDWLREQAKSSPVVFPVHPRTRQAGERFGLSFEGLRAIEPLGYLDMTRLVAGSRAVFTDSGGLQKEAYFHRVPCVTLRGETEWVETIDCGWNRLWSESDYAPRRDIDEYGDGTAAETVATVLAERYAS